MNIASHHAVDNLDDKAVIYLRHCIAVVMFLTTAIGLLVHTLPSVAISSCFCLLINTNLNLTNLPVFHTLPAAVVPAEWDQLAPYLVTRQPQPFLSIHGFEVVRP
jgi:hypothetical protein